MYCTFVPLLRVVRRVYNVVGVRVSTVADFLLIGMELFCVFNFILCTVLCKVNASCWFYFMEKVRVVGCP